MPEKHVVFSLMLALKNAEVKSEAVLVHMYQGSTAIKYHEEKGKKAW